MTKEFKKGIDQKDECHPIPKDTVEAVSWIVPLLDLKTTELQSKSNSELMKAWHSISYLFTGLHPDGILDNGHLTSNEAEDVPIISKIEPRLINPHYARSGWPLILVPIAREAMWRFKMGILKPDEFYCSEAQIAGLKSGERK